MSQNLEPQAPSRDVLISAWRRDQGNGIDPTLPPPKVLRYANPRLTLHNDNLSKLRQQLLESCENYALNYLPTHLLRISDMTLVTRTEYWEAEQSWIEKKLEEDLCKKMFAKSMSGIDPEKSSPDDWDLLTWGDEAAEIRRDVYIRKLFKFAIFSHRWGADEPQFRDFSERNLGDAPVLVGLGYEKLLTFCDKARTDFDCQYVWSDTCCIDKENSVELDEAIRSMYRWYSIATVCIVHLAQSTTVDDFGSEPWFTRGWTLQELLAPRVIKFYGKDWQPISQEENEKGDKAVREIWMAIELVTGISRNHLWQFFPSCDRVAEKMVWASKRRTMKIEDVAYSLLGLFDIDMLIAYGEADRAWYRLMGAIANACTDASFFAWAGQPSPHSRAFPSSPACYMRLDPRIPASSIVRRHPSYEVTKLGVLVPLLMIPIRCNVLGDDNSREIGLAVTPHSLEPFLVGAEISHRGLEEYRLGIVNFRSRDDDAFVEAGDQCHCLVVAREHTDDLGWIKVNTECVIVVRCMENIFQPSDSVLLYHTGGYEGDFF